MRGRAWLATLPLAVLLVPAGAAALLDTGNVLLGYSKQFADHFHTVAYTDPRAGSCSSTGAIMVRIDLAPGSVVGPASCDQLDETQGWGLSYVDPVRGPITGPCRTGPALVAIAGAPTPCSMQAQSLWEYDPATYAHSGDEDFATWVEGDYVYRAAANQPRSTSLRDIVVHHRMEPASPDFAVVHVTVTNESPRTLEDVHYRRVMQLREVDEAPTDAWAATPTRVWADGVEDPPSTLTCFTNSGVGERAPQSGDCLIPTLQPDQDAMRCADDGSLIPAPVAGPGAETGPGQPWAFFPQGHLACGQGFLWDFDLQDFGPGESRRFRYYVGGLMGGHVAVRDALLALPVPPEFWGIAEAGTMGPNSFPTFGWAWQGLTPPVVALRHDAPVPAWASHLPSTFQPGTTACAGETVSFAATVDPGSHPLASGVWTFGDGTSLATGADAGTPAHAFQATGTYTVRLEVRDQGGWRADALLVVDVVDCRLAPQAAILGVRSAGTCTDTLVHVTGTGSDPDGTSSMAYAWDFGDGATASGAVATHQYVEDRAVVIRLTATDDDGQSTTASMPWAARADFNCPPELEVPVTRLAAPAGTTFQFGATATDADDVPWLVLAQSPLGATLASSPGAAATTGQFTWATTPQTPKGDYLVRLLATDGHDDASRTVDLVLSVRPRPSPDGDGDGVADLADNCAATGNGAQEDQDADQLGDACDGGVRIAGPGQAPAITLLPDRDHDGVTDAADNCVWVINPQQSDLDSDGVGDACDGDMDGDGVPEGDLATDNCPLRANPDQADQDHDGDGDACDGLSATAPLPTPPGPVVLATGRARTAGADDTDGPAPWIGLAAGLLLLAGVVRLMLREPWVVAFSRLRRDALLDQPTRSRLLDAVEADPGIRFLALARTTGLGRGTVRHHLELLQQAGVVQRVQRGRHVGFVRTGGGRDLPAPGPAGTGQALLRHLGRRQLGIRELARAAGVNPGTVLYHVRRLEEDGFVATRRDEQRLVVRRL